MKIGLIIVGAEILSGKREDRHLSAVIDLLGERGLTLSWVQIVDDDFDSLSDTLKASMQSGDVVFSTGGIGATPDDCTRQAAAAASGQSLCRHPAAVEKLESLFGESAYPHRIRMAELPENADLIDNPISGVPGFSVEDHHFVPGFPSMAWPMIEDVLDRLYADRFPAQRPIERLLSLKNVPESELVPLMEQIEEDFPTIRLSCLPHAENGMLVNEYGFRGQEADVEAARAAFLEGIESMGLKNSLLD